jgi:hypothetical protein
MIPPSSSPFPQFDDNSFLESRKKSMKKLFTEYRRRGHWEYKKLYPNEQNGRD